MVVRRAHMGRNSRGAGSHCSRFKARLQGEVGGAQPAKRARTDRCHRRSLTHSQRVAAEREDSCPDGTNWWGCVTGADFPIGEVRVAWGLALHTSWGAESVFAALAFSFSVFALVSVFAFRRGPGSAFGSTHGRVIVPGRCSYSA